MKDKPLYEVLKERLLRSFLDIEIVSLLVSKEEVTGYEIVLFLHRKTGRLFSPGTIYPILHRMEKEGMIKSRIKGHRRPYVLTDEGRLWYDDILNTFPEVLEVLNR